MFPFINTFAATFNESTGKDGKESAVQVRSKALPFLQPLWTRHPVLKHTLSTEHYARGQPRGKPWPHVNFNKPIKSYGVLEEQAAVRAQGATSDCPEPVNPMSVKEANIPCPRRSNQSLSYRCSLQTSFCCVSTFYPRYQTMTRPSAVESLAHPRWPQGNWWRVVYARKAALLYKVVNLCF